MVYMHFLHSGNMKDFIVGIQNISLLQYQKCKIDAKKITELHTKALCVKEVMID